MLKITNDMLDIKESNASVVAFTAVWCGPCTQLKPQFAKAAVQDNKTDYFVVDIDKIDKEYLDLYNIKSVPSVFVMSNGDIVKKVSSRTTTDILSEVKS